jgi:hypothetical protein
VKEWQFDVLFFVGVGGAIFLLVAPAVGLNIGNSPLAISGVGAILSYVLTQRKNIVKDDEKEKTPQHRKGEDNGSP